MAEQAQEVPQEAEVKVVPDEAEDLLSLGPVVYAKSLCDKAGLTRAQRGPVALIARDMQTAYEAEQQRREALTEQQRQALGSDIAGKALLPLVGRLVRILIFGGADAATPKSV